MNEVIEKPKNFILGAYEELKKVQWPTKKEVIRLTGFVIAISVGAGLFVMMFDYMFTHLLTSLLAK